MIVSTKQTDLAKALGIVSRAVSPRSTLPVLGNILIDANSGELRLSATNREMAISCWIGAAIDDPGAITITARLLTEYINSLPPELVCMDLNTRTQTLCLSCAKFTANMKGIDAFEFPLIPTYHEERTDNTPVIDGQRYTVSVETLRTAISAVTVAASQDENRPTLTGIECTFDGNTLHMAATDGYRLATYQLACTGDGEPTTVIIPNRNLAEVARIAGSATGDATIIVSDNRNQVLFSLVCDVGRVDVVTELIDARFPDYRATIPKGHDTRTVVDTAALLKAVRVALLFARDNANIIRVSVAPGKGKSMGQMRISATSVEMGDNASELDAHVDGKEIEIAFNARYMIDALSQVDRPSVVIETTIPTRPAMLRPIGEDSPYMAVLMPMAPPK